MKIFHNKTTVLFINAVDIYEIEQDQIKKFKYDLIFVPEFVKYPYQFKDEKFVKIYEFRGCAFAQLNEGGEIIYY